MQVWAVFLYAEFGGRGFRCEGPRAPAPGGYHHRPSFEADSFGFGLGCVELGLQCGSLGLQCGSFELGCVGLGFGCVGLGLQCGSPALGCVGLALCWLCASVLDAVASVLDFNAEVLDFDATVLDFNAKVLDFDAMVLDFNASSVLDFKNASHGIGHLLLHQSWTPLRRCWKSVLGVSLESRCVYRCVGVSTRAWTRGVNPQIGFRDGEFSQMNLFVSYGRRCVHRCVDVNVCARPWGGCSNSFWGPLYEGSFTPTSQYQRREAFRPENR